MTLQLFVVILSGVLALASPGVLERVQAHRLEHGWGLHETAGPDVVLLALEDCGELGRRGVIVVNGEEFAAYVVDCQQAEHRQAQPMSKRGLVGDVNRASLNHQRATVLLR